MKNEFNIEESFDSFLNSEDLDGDYNELLYCYEAGYRAKQTEIQKLIEVLEESMKEYGKDLDIARRINYEQFTQSKIKTLKALL